MFGTNSYFSIDAALEPFSLVPLKAMFDQENKTMKPHMAKRKVLSLPETCAAATTFIYCHL